MTILSVRFGTDSIALSHEFVNQGRIRVEVVNPTVNFHHLFVVKTDLDSAMLPRASDNTVNVGDLDVVWDTTLPNGARRTNTLDLRPGQYVFFCNEPFHYRYGEFNTLVVE